MPERKVSILIQAKDAATRTLNRVRGSFSNTAKTITAAFSFVGLTLGLRRFTDFLGSSIRAFKVQEDAVTSLRAALEQTGKTGEDALESIVRQAENLQKVTTKADEALIAASASLALLAPALDPQELAEAQKAIIGIADVFLKGDVEAAASLLGKTLGSTTNALTRYGIRVDTSATQGEKLRQVLGQTNKMFEVSLERGKTLAGLTERLANAWGDFKEQVGKLVAQRAKLVEFLDTARRVVETMTLTFSEGTADDIRDLFERLGKIAALGFSAGLIKGFREIQNVFRDIFTPQMLEPVFDALAQVAGGFLADRLGDAFAKRMNELMQELAPRVAIGEVFNPFVAGGGGQFGPIVRPPPPLESAAARRARFLREGLPVTTPSELERLQRFPAQLRGQLRPGIIDLTDAFSPGGAFEQFPDVVEEANTFAKRLAANFQNVGNIMANQFTGGLTSAIFGLQSFGDALRNFVIQLAQQAVGGFIRSLIPIPGFSVAGPMSIRLSVSDTDLQQAALDSGIYASSPQAQQFLIRSLEVARFGGFRG